MLRHFCFIAINALIWLNTMVSASTATVVHNGLTYYNLFSEAPAADEIRTLGQKFEFNFYVPGNVSQLLEWTFQVNGDVAVAGQSWSVPIFSYRSSRSSFVHGTAITEFEVSDANYLHVVVDTALPARLLEKDVRSVELRLFPYISYFDGPRWITQQRELRLSYFAPVTPVPVPPAAPMLLSALTMLLFRSFKRQRQTFAELAGLMMKKQP